jgi:hypothetical protein
MSEADVGVFLSHQPERLLKPIPGNQAHKFFVIIGTSGQIFPWAPEQMKLSALKGGASGALAGQRV